MRIKLNLILSAILIFSCEKGSIEYSRMISFEEASTIVTKHMLLKDSSIIVYGNPEILKRGIYPIILYWIPPESLTAENDSWLFITDFNYPHTNSIFGWYSLVDASDGHIYSQGQGLMPKDISNYNIVYPTKKNILSKEQAEEEFLHLILSNESKSAIFMHHEMLKTGDKISVDVTNNEHSINKDSWFFIIDRTYIRYNIPRSFGYFLMDATSGLIYSNFGEYYPPSNFSEMDTINYKWYRTNRRLPNLNFTANSSHKACCNFLVYLENEDETALIKIRGDTTKLNFINDSLVLDFKNQIVDLELLIYHYFYLPVNYFSPLSFKCDDTGGTVGYAKHIWYPISGKMIIERSYNQYNQLSLTFEFTNMMFKSDSVDSEIIINFFRKENIAIAYCPG